MANHSCIGESQNTVSEHGRWIANDMINENHVEREATKKIYARIAQAGPGKAIAFVAGFTVGELK